MNINLFNSDPNIERYPAGEIIFREGERGEHMFAVIDGAVEISFKGKLLETVGPGSVFGEMALIEGETRGATVVVKEAAGLVRIDRKRFLFLVQQTPYFSLQLMSILAARLRRMNAGIGTETDGLPRSLAISDP